MADRYSGNSLLQTSGASTSRNDDAYPLNYETLLPHVSSFLDPYYSLLIQQMHIQNEQHYSLPYPYQRLPMLANRQFQQQLTTLVDTSASHTQGKPFLLSHTLVRAEHLLTHQAKHQLFQLPTCMQQQMVLLKDVSSIQNSYLQCKSATTESENSQMALLKNDNMLNCSLCHKVILPESKQDANMMHRMQGDLIFRKNEADPLLQEQSSSMDDNKNVNVIPGVRETFYKREYLLNSVYHRNAHHPNSLRTQTATDLEGYNFQNSMDSCDQNINRQWNHNIGIKSSEASPFTNQTKPKNKDENFVAESTLKIVKSESCPSILDEELNCDKYRPGSDCEQSKNTEDTSSDTDVKKSDILRNISFYYKCQKNVASTDFRTNLGDDKETQNNASQSCSNSLIRPVCLNDCTTTSLSSSSSSPPPSSSLSLKQQTPSIPIPYSEYIMSQSGVRSGEMPEKCQQTQTNETLNTISPGEHGFRCLTDVRLVLADSKNKATDSGNLPFSIERILANHFSSTDGGSDSRSVVANPRSPFMGKINEEVTASRSSRRRTRTNFNCHQMTALEETFRGSHYPDVSVRELLASSLQLTESRIQVWFQNRRTKYRKQEHTKKGPGRPAHNAQLRSCSGQPMSLQEINAKEKARLDRRKRKTDKRLLQWMDTRETDVLSELESNMSSSTEI